MKLTTSVFSALVALALSAQAATVTVSNLPQNTPVPIQGRDGQNLASGSVAIGIFNGDVSALTDVAALKGAFQQFGASVSMGFNGLAGLYQNTISDTVGGTAFSGKNVYTVVGDGGDIASSNGLFVYDHGFTFVDEPGATPDAVVRADGNVIFGSAVTANLNGTDFQGFRMGPPIPEPSSAMLGLLGLSFLFFRRRK